MPHEKATKKITNLNESPQDLTSKIDIVVDELPSETASAEQDPSDSNNIEQTRVNTIDKEKKAKLKADRKKLEKEKINEILINIDAKFDKLLDKTTEKIDELDGKFTDKFNNQELRHESLEQKITTEIFDENQAKDLAKQINAGIPLNALQRALYEKTKDMVDPMLQNKKESNWEKIKKIIIDKLFTKK